jgi:hypothetical protein
MIIHRMEQLAQKTLLEIPGTSVTLDSLFSGGRDTRSRGARDLRAHIVSQSGVPRWVLPENTRGAVTVLRSWKPYKLKSRLQWSTIIGASRLNAVGSLPGIARATLRYDSSYWCAHVPAFSDSWEVLAYIGNIFPTRKALIFFVDESARVRAVAKVPIYPAAKAAILNEVSMLTKLRDRLPVPGVLFSDEEQGIAAQSWMEGVNIPRRFGREHLDLLTRFGSEISHVRLSDWREEFEERTALLQFVDSSLLKRALVLLEVRDDLKTCVEHGDFVPWNFRRLADGRLTLIDWEWAVENGLPWQDVCRYFYLQDFLFREGRNVWNMLTMNPLLSEYRRRFELSYEAVRRLTIRYLLRYLCDEYAEGNLDRVAYAAHKVSEVLDSPK